MHKKLSVVTISTKSYINIINDYFLSTLPDSVDRMKILYLNNMDNVPRNKAADFEIKKLEMIIEEMKINMGHNLFFIDGDVVFSHNGHFKDEVNKMLEEYDLLFQFNDLWYNFGVFAISCTEKTLEFFEHFVNVEMPKCYDNTSLHDQHIVNGLLGIYHPNAGFSFSVDKEFAHLKHNHLPYKYFANHFENHKYPYSVPEDVVFLHATNTPTLQNKLNLMTEFKLVHYDSKRSKK